MFKPIETFAEANCSLFSISEQIEQKTGELEAARERYLYAKARWENNQARYLLETKLKYPTMVQSEILASAINLSYQDKLDYIKYESAYRRLVGELKALRDRLSVYQEISWNLRRERVQG